MRFHVHPIWFECNGELRVPAFDVTPEDDEAKALSEEELRRVARPELRRLIEKRRAERS